MSVYFNEFDPFAAAWLRNLYPAATVDDRSILDVRPEDLSGRTRAHFFAGIAGWELALGIAGWPAGLSAWTGSCPCQPFSTAGKRKGEADKRHLWPEFFRLIRECRPRLVVGEQVENAVRLGWLDGVFADLEGAGYACGAAVLGAHSVGAPHIRQRLYWVAYSEHDGLHRPTERTKAVSDRNEPIERIPLRGRTDGGLEYSDGGGCRKGGILGGLPEILRGGADIGESSASAGSLCAWSRYRIIECRDIDKRTGRNALRRVPVEPEFFPLAYGVPGSVGRVRAYGNAIVPQVAATFLRAVMDCIGVQPEGRSW